MGWRRSPPESRARALCRKWREIGGAERRPHVSSEWRHPAHLSAQPALRSQCCAGVHAGFWGAVLLRERRE